MRDIFPDDCPLLPFEILAWAMSSWNGAQRAIILTGDGSNGKSTFLAALSAFLGSANVSGVSLQKLEEDRFATARLYQMLANISADLPARAPRGTSILKSLTGGDRIHAENKFKRSFEFVSFAKLIFSANQLPWTPDASDGFFRRLIIVPFMETFDDSGGISREEFDAWLASPEELSGALNEALKVLPAFREKGFSGADTLTEAAADYRESANPLRRWLDSNVQLASGEFVPKADLINAYNSANPDSPMTKNAFGRLLSREIPGVQTGQRTCDGHVREVYLGIRRRS